MEFLTPEEVAKILNISNRTARKLGEAKVLPGAAKIGKQWRFRKDLLMDWLSKQTELRKKQEKKPRKRKEMVQEALAFGPREV